MKINFSLLQFEDLDGNKSKDVQKDVWRAINLLTLDMELADIAKSIFKGEEVELSQQQVEAVKIIIKDERAGFFPLAQREILTYIDKV